jgi:hypothetical protein
MPAQSDGTGTFYFVGEKVRLKWIPIKADEKEGGFFAGMNWEYFHCRLPATGSHSRSKSLTARYCGLEE